MTGLEKLIARLEALVGLVDVPHNVQKLLDLAWSERRRPTICSVVLLADLVENDKAVVQGVTFALQRDDARRHQISVQVPIKAGAWLVGLNGALVQDLRVGVNAQDVGVSEGGPVARTIEPVMPGVPITFTVKLLPDEWLR